MNYSWKRASGIALLAVALAIPAFAGSRGRGGNNWWQGLAGTVTAVNASANTLSVQAQIGNQTTSVTLAVPAAVPVIRYSNVGLSGLKVGDSIRVNGLPLAIQATAIQASSVTPATGETTSSTAPTAKGEGLGHGPSGSRSGATAVGTVQSVDAANSRVIVTVGEALAVTVTVPADLQITRQDQVTLADVQVGDKIQARVTVSSTGAVTAVTLEAQAATPAAGGTTTAGTTGSAG